MKTRTFRPIFVELMPEPHLVKAGELWISPKHRTINLRCPCGCDQLTVLSMHPTRWHINFDGKAVTLDGPTGGSIWTTSECGSHYFIKQNAVHWAAPISRHLKGAYEKVERARLLDAQPNPPSGLRRIARTVLAWFNRE